MFKSEFFAGNRRKLFESCDATMLIVAANMQMQRNGDSGFPFRQDSNFWYLTGINEPDCTLVITEHESYIILPYKDPVMQVFDGVADRAETKQISGVSYVYANATGWAKFKEQLKNCDKIATLLPSNLRRHALAVNPARHRLIKRIKRHKPEIEIEDVRLQIAHQRMIKQPEEIKAIKQAITITGDALKSVFRGQWYSKFLYENEIEAMLTAYFRKAGASGHAYTPVVSSGKHTCTLHYNQNTDRIRKGSMVLLDVGAEFSNYAADISRVYPAAKQFTKRQQEVVAAVKEVQEYAYSLIKPGVSMRDYELAVEAYMGQKLKQLRLIKTQSRRQIRKYYPHATSHMLGLDPHDAADYGMPFTENMVMTVEPGIYIPDENLGVRLEDNVLITKTGVQILSADIK